MKYKIEIYQNLRLIFKYTKYFFLILFFYNQSLGQITCTSPSGCSGAQSDAAKFRCKVYENANYTGQSLPNLTIGQYARMYLTAGQYTWQASGSDGNCGSIVKLELQKEGVGAYVYTNSACSAGTINTTDGQAGGIYIRLVVYPCMEGWYLLGATVNSGVLNTCSNCSGNISGWSNSYSCSPTPSISSQPSNTSKCPSANATFTVAGTNASSYQWQYYNGISWTNVSNGTPTNAAYTNATTATLTIGGAISGGPYQYRCIVYSSGGCSVTSNSATLTNNSNPSITAHPSTSNFSTCLNQTAYSPISVSATGTVTLTYQWYFNTTASNSGGTIIAGATSSSYTPPNNAANVRYYYCIVSNGCGSATSNVSGSYTTNALPADPVAPSSNSPQCLTVTLTHNGTATYYWQGSSCGTSTTLGNATTYGVSSDGTYYIRNLVSGCWSANCASVVADVVTNSSPASSSSASSASGCSPLSTTLTFSGGTLGAGDTWRLYSSDVCSDAGAILVGSTTSTPAVFNLTGISATTTYYVRAEGSCGNTSCYPVTVTINNATITAPTLLDKDPD